MSRPCRSTFILALAVLGFAAGPAAPVAAQTPGQSQAPGSAVAPSTGPLQRGAAGAEAQPCLPYPDCRVLRLAPGASQNGLVPRGLGESDLQMPRPRLGTSTAQDVPPPGGAPAPPMR